MGIRNVLSGTGDLAYRVLVGPVDGYLNRSIQVGEGFLTGVAITTNFVDSTPVLVGTGMGVGIARILNELYGSRRAYRNQHGR